MPAHYSGSSLHAEEKTIGGRRLPGPRDDDQAEPTGRAFGDAPHQELAGPVQQQRVRPAVTAVQLQDRSRPIGPARDAFREKGVMVGRDFPPMLEHLRVSIGTEEEMARFMTAFKEIFPSGPGSAPTVG